MLSLTHSLTHSLIHLCLQEQHLLRVMELMQQTSAQAEQLSHSLDAAATTAQHRYAAQPAPPIDTTATTTQYTPAEAETDVGHDVLGGGGYMEDDHVEDDSQPAVDPDTAVHPRLQFYF